MTNEQPVRVNIATGEYTTTDISVASVLLDAGCEVIAVESAGGYPKRRARWVFDDSDGRARHLANECYQHPERVVINLAAFRAATKQLIMIANQVTR